MRMSGILSVWRVGILDLEKVSWTQLIAGRGIEGSIAAFEESFAAEAFPLLLTQFKALCVQSALSEPMAGTAKLLVCLLHAALLMTVSGPCV